MTQDEIIKLAKEAGFKEYVDIFGSEQLERFAALVREDEREKIALAHKIRPRGKSVYQELLAEREKQQVVSSKMEHTTQEPVAYKYKESSPETGEFVFAAPVSAKREWVDLTDEDRRDAFESLPDALEGFLKKWGWLQFAKEIERRCKEKNK